MTHPSTITARIRTTVAFALYRLADWIDSHPRLTFIGLAAMGKPLATSPSFRYVEVLPGWSWVGPSSVSATSAVLKGTSSR